MRTKERCTNNNNVNAYKQTAGVTAASRFIPFFFEWNKLCTKQRAKKSYWCLLSLILWIFFSVFVQFFFEFSSLFHFCCDISLSIIFLGSRSDSAAAAAISDTTKFCYFFFVSLFFLLSFFLVWYFFRFGTFLFKLAFFHCVLVILGCLRLQLYGFV